MSVSGIAALVLMILIGISGCSPSKTGKDGSGAAVPSEPPIFINRVWKVSESTEVALGQFYTFLAEGTLVTASATGTPSLGTWSYDGHTLTMVEGGIAYTVDILELSEREFRIRSNNPGGFVDIRLVPADN